MKERVQHSGSGPTRATTRIAPTMDEEAGVAASWHGRGDPLWSPSLGSTPHFHQSCHSPTMSCKAGVVWIRGGEASVPTGKRGFFPLNLTLIGQSLRSPCRPAVNLGRPLRSPGPNLTLVRIAAIGNTPLERNHTMRIDVHAHYFPDEYLDLLQRFGSDATYGARNMGASGKRAELEARFELMDSVGVQRQILSVSPQLPYFENETHAVEAAQMINDL